MIIHFFDIPHLKAEAKKLADSTGIGLSKARNELARAKGYSSWEVLTKHVVGPDKPEALVAWFERKHEPMRDEVDTWIYEELLSESRPEQVLTEAGYDTSKGFDAAVDQIWDRSVWYSRAQVEMADWFVRNHSSAVDHSPYDSREGGYLWPTVEVLDLLQHQFPEMPEKDIDEVAEALDAQGPWIESKWVRQTDEEALRESLDGASLVPARPMLGQTMQLPPVEKLLGATGMAALEQNIRNSPVYPNFEHHPRNAFIENIVKPIMAASETGNQEQEGGQAPKAKGE